MWGDACPNQGKPFGWLRGLDKHHCRYCGWAVCDDCSKQRLFLDRWLEPDKPHAVCYTRSTEPLRVCNGCYRHHLTLATTAASAHNRGGEGQPQQQEETGHVGGGSRDTGGDGADLMGQLGELVGGNLNGARAMQVEVWRQNQQLSRTGQVRCKSPIRLI